ncbi:hypothetical protein YPPY45_4373, partial [Yersinia pestis PY-45]
MGLAAAVEC